MTGLRDKAMCLATGSRDLAKSYESRVKTADSSPVLHMDHVRTSLNESRRSMVGIHQ